MKRPSILGAFVAVIVASILPVSAAFAHASLDNSVPVSGATLVQSPSQIVLDFDETVETALGFIRLFDSSGTRVDLPDISRDAADNSIIRVDVPRLDDDTYVVTYRVVSVDGHAVDGAITFQVGAGPKIDVTDLLTSALSDVDRAGSVDAVLRPVRLVGYLALGLVMAGIFLLLGLGSASVATIRSLRRVIAAASGVYCIASIGLLALQGAALAGEGVASAFSWSTVVDVSNTRVGHALLVRTALSGLLALAALVALRSTHRASILRFFGVFGFVVFPLTYSFGGHVGAVSPLVPAVAVSVMHVAAVATWFGGLVLLATHRSLRDASTVKWFSGRAAVLVGVAVVSGVAQSLLVVDDAASLLDITYGKVLAVKVGAVVAMLMTAALVRRRFLESGVERLRSVLIAEAIAGVVVLGVTSGLVAETPRSIASAAPFATTLVQGDTLVNVTVSPNRVGSVEMHVIVTKPGGSLEPVVSARVRLSSSQRDVPPIAVEPAEVGPNHFVASAQIPFAGEWKLDIITVEEDNRESLFTTVIDVRP